MEATMPLPDPADLAWHEEMQRERAHRAWIAQHADNLDELLNQLREAYFTSRKVWGSDGDDIPAGIIDLIEMVEGEMEP
jgi:hypothetical protein